MNNTKPAVFARNHLHYLEEAAALSPAQPVTFRSVTHWSGAAQALADQSTIPVYFAAVGEGPIVTYAAELLAVLVNPGVMDPETERFLAFSLPSTIEEGLWEEYESSVKTLYMVKRCRELDPPFPMTQLVKLSNDEPISPNYGYSYSIVYQRGAEPGNTELLFGEVSEPGQYWEGATRQVFVTTYERSSAARAACIRHHGLDGAACGFNFGARYGDMGKGYIHVHHLVPLSETDEKYEVDPIKDLIPVCPNCHEMIHKEKPPLGIDDLRGLLQRDAG